MPAEANATNPELQLAGEYVRHTDRHIFLTGKAGTGKTTFLHTIRDTCPKRLVVTAPTGVAAINAGGVTLHSFFQLPFGPCVPGDDTARSRYRFGRDKLAIVRTLDLLIIDEISMVRADVLDAVDAVLRRLRRNDAPFGGVQLLMIGDLFQLPPVVKPNEWQLLQPFYDTPYFFGSNALRTASPVTIELRHIFRQQDQTFIELLNRVRTNRMDGATLDALNARCRTALTPEETDRCTTLCTHNRQADAINAAKLAALPHPAQRFEARIQGDFPPQLFPTAASLTLKPGARVMFVRNDPTPEKRYFNGKTGTVTRMSGDTIRVRCPDDRDAITVEPIVWENVAYTLDPETLRVTANTTGTFSQYPLAPAWAITIHKSQGLTFDNAIIDAQAAFAHGQVYVALSRCRTIEGLVLSTPLTSTAIRTDPAVVRFDEEVRHRTPTAADLATARIDYQQRMLLECFDFGRLGSLLGRLVSLLQRSSGSLHLSGASDLPEVQRRTATEICTVGAKFKRQLQGLFSASTPPSDDDAVTARVTKAAAYFGEKIASGPADRLAELEFDTDNQELRKTVTTAIDRLNEEIAIKRAAVQSCSRGFSPARYFTALAAARIAASPSGPSRKTAAPPKAPTVEEADITHHALFADLKAWRRQKAQAEGVPPFRVMHLKTLVQVAVHLPDSDAALLRIKGIGKHLAERYGGELTSLVAAYRRRHGITEANPNGQAPDRADRR